MSQLPLFATVADFMFMVNAGLCTTPMTSDENL
jgi:hypothetical protein